MRLIDVDALLKDLGDPHPMDYNANATIAIIKKQPMIVAVDGHAFNKPDGITCKHCKYFAHHTIEDFGFCIKHDYHLKPEFHQNDWFCADAEKV